MPRPRRVERRPVWLRSAHHRDAVTIERPNTSGRRFMDRFFCPELRDHTTVTIADDEFHHLAHVLRVKPGERVELFDGRGRAVECLVERITKREAHLARTGNLREDEPDHIRLVLGVACPKGDRLKWLVEKATELGVAELVPLKCERSVVEPRETKVAKLEQTILAACKQCRRNTLMSIGESQSIEQFLKQPARLSLIAHPGGRSFASMARRLIDPDQADRITVRAAIGPEGGFTDEEVATAESLGALKLSLGRSILRVETAALAVSALVFGLSGLEEQ